MFEKVFVPNVLYRATGIRLNSLKPEYAQTQSLFEDVLENPQGTNHQNIRNFMKTGWDGIQFEGNALKLKS